MVNSSLKAGQFAPIVPWVIDCYGSPSPFRIGEVKRVEVLYHTAKMVRLADGSGYGGPCGQQNVRCCPDELAWLRLQELRADAQLALDEFWAKIRALGHYPDELESRGGFKKNPFPLAPYTVDAGHPPQHPDWTGGHVPGLLCHVSAVLRHTNKMIESADSSWGSKPYLQDQIGHYLILNESQAESIRELGALTKADLDAYRNFLSGLGTYQEALADGRYKSLEPAAISGFGSMERTREAGSGVSSASSLPGPTELDQNEVLPDPIDAPAAEVSLPPSVAGSSLLQSLEPAGIPGSLGEKTEAVNGRSSASFLSSAPTPLATPVVSSGSAAADPHSTAADLSLADGPTETTAPDPEVPDTVEEVERIREGLSEGQAANPPLHEEASSGPPQAGLLAPSVSPDSGPLATLQDLLTDLAAAAAPDEAKQVADKAETLRTFFKRVGASRTVLHDIAETKVRAERRAGELLLAADLDQGGRPDKEGNRVAAAAGRIRLEDLGISHLQSSLWKRMAQVPPEHFEEAIRRIRASRSEDITTRTVLRFATPKKKNPPAGDVPDGPPLTLGDLALDDVVATIADDPSSRWGRRGRIAFIYPERGSVLVYPLGGGEPWEAAPAELVLISKAAGAPAASNTAGGSSEQNAGGFEHFNTQPRTDGDETAAADASAEAIEAASSGDEAQALTRAERDGWKLLLSVHGVRLIHPDHGGTDWYEEVTGAWIAAQELAVGMADSVDACRHCGCTDSHACEGGCFWVEDNLCSSCVRTELGTLREQLQQATEQITGLESRLQEQAAALAQRDQQEAIQLEEVISSRTALQTRLDEALAALARREEELANLEKEIALVRSEKPDIKKHPEFVALEAYLRVVEATKRQSQQRADQFRGQAEQAALDLEQANLKLAAAQRETGEALTAKKEVEKQLKQAQKEAEKEAARLRRQIQESERQKDFQLARAEQLEQQLKVANHNHQWALQRIQALEAPELPCLSSAAENRVRGHA